MLKLVIGNKSYSSWSLRAWLYLRESGIPFEEIRLALFTPGFREELARHTPAGRVPVLIDGALRVWDSMAIIEHLRETRPGALPWPEEPAARARALARSICAEMHAGFAGIRDELPQNLRVRGRMDPQRLSEGCRAEIARVEDMWCGARRDHGAGGPGLFGALSIPDVVYAPVALRFATYGIDLAPEAEAFVATLSSRPTVREFVAAAREESEHLDFIDAVARDLVPEAQDLVPEV